MSINDYTTLAQLKELPQWFCWKIVYRDDKEIKLPINPHNGRAASTKDPSTWATAEQAWRAKVKRKLSGIGFVFTAERGIVGVDLDNCFDEDGSLKSEPLQIVQCLNSYTEYSPSGKGLHIFVRGSIPSAIKKNKQGVEMYAEGRYFTVTGKEFGASEFVNSTIEHRQDELMALWVVYKGYPENKPAMKRTYTDTNIEKIQRALSFIPPQMDYSEWLRVLMAVHSEYPGMEGVQLIEAWSPGHNGEVEAKFKSFNRNEVTVNSLFYMARQHGYTLPPMGDTL